jgi:putative restriction endonuclease
MPPREEILSEFVGLLPAATVLEGSGWPATVRFFDGVRNIEARVYVSQIGEPGVGASGRARPAYERRFQNPGKGHPIRMDPERATLLLGVASQERTAENDAAAHLPAVIAAFDAARHRDRETRISVQMHVDTLRLAAARGYATQLKGNGELIVAFRPALIGEYIDSIRPLVHTGDQCRPEDAEEVLELFEMLDISTLLGRGGDIPEAVERQERERVRVVALRRARDRQFALRVTQAYEGRCAVCGVELGLVVAAHIDPVEADGPDVVNNGLCLCPNHHRAFDGHLLEIDEDDGYRLSLNEQALAQLGQRGLLGGLDAFHAELPERMTMPARAEHRPNPEYFKRRREWYFPVEDSYEGDDELL